MSTQGDHLIIEHCATYDWVSWTISENTMSWSDIQHKTMHFPSSQEPP